MADQFKTPKTRRESFAPERPGPFLAPEKNDVRPNARDADPSRGVLQYVPQGVRMVGDFGSPPRTMRGRPSPAKADHTAPPIGGHEGDPGDGCANIQPGIKR